MKLVFPAAVEPQDGGFLVTFRDLPEAITEGDTLEEALLNAEDCLDEAIAGRLDDSEAIPKPSAPLQAEHLVVLPIETSLKLALMLAVSAHGLTKTALAQLLEVDEKVARRLLDPHYSSKLSVMQKALRALKAGVAIEVDDYATA